MHAGTHVGISNTCEPCVQILNIIPPPPKKNLQVKSVEDIHPILTSGWGQTEARLTTALSHDASTIYRATANGDRSRSPWKCAPYFKAEAPLG
jgi:hypothetical protein